MILVCKKDIDNRFVAGKSYAYKEYKTVRQTGDFFIFYGIVGNDEKESRFTDNEQFTWYVWKYFYSHNEVRKLKLQKLKQVALFGV